MRNHYDAFAKLGEVLEVAAGAENAIKCSTPTTCEQRIDSPLLLPRGGSLPHEVCYQ